MQTLLPEKYLRKIDDQASHKGTPKAYKFLFFHQKIHYASQNRLTFPFIPFSGNKRIAEGILFFEIYSNVHKAYHL